MKKTIYLTIFIVIAVIGLQSLTPPVIIKKDGAAPGYTGSPGDSLKNCTACHGGIAVPVDNWITSNIPPDGYEPGKIYTITATNKEIGATRFGFEVSPQNLAGKLMGTMLITDMVRTKLVGDDKYITYTEYGVEGQDSLAWSFDWIAPTTGAGVVTFYGGFNSNYEGHKSGDQTYLSSISIKEKGTTSTADNSRHKALASIYPNPAEDQFNVDFSLEKQATVSINIYDINGKLVNTMYKRELPSGKHNLQFTTSKLATGNYVAKVLIGEKSYDEKIIIK